jgi:hypothetical protein
MNKLSCLVIPEKTVRSDYYKKLMKGSEFAMLQLLTTSIVRNVKFSSKLRLYERFYLHGKLVASVPQEIMAEWCNVSLQTIKNWTKKLLIARAIKVYKVGCIGSYPCNVYELGTVNQKTKKETLYHLVDGWRK